MIQNYKIVTLCGSTRFKDQFLETQKRLTLEGCIVISVGLFGHSGDEEVWKPGTKEMLDYARHHHVKRIFLEGNTHLEASISLYRKLGFKEIPLSGNAYERCDILMELVL